MKKNIILIYILMISIITKADILDIVPNTSEEYRIFHDMSVNSYFSVKSDFFETDRSRLEFAKKISQFLEKYRLEPEIRKNTRENRENIYKLTTFFREELEFFTWNDENIRLLLKINKEQAHKIKNEDPVKEKRQNDRKRNNINRKSERKTLSGNIKITTLLELSQFSSPSENYSGLIAIIDYTNKIIRNDSELTFGFHNDSLSFDNDDRKESHELDDILYLLNYETRKNGILFKIGRNRESELSGLLIDNFTTDRFSVLSGDYEFKIMSLEKKITDYPGMRFSHKSDAGGTFSLKYRLNEKIYANAGKISGIDMDSNGIEDNSFTYIGGCYRKLLEDSDEIKFTALIYDYEKLMPSIGLTDSRSLAAHIGYRKERIEFDFTLQQSGFAYTIGSDQFETFTDLSRPVFRMLGYNGNVNDLNLIYRPDDSSYIKLELISPETNISGNADANVISVGKDFEVSGRKYSADICIIDKDDTSAFFNGSLNNMFGWQNISSTGNNISLRIISEIRF